MTWAPGYQKESYTEFPSVEEASATLSNIESTAPNRAEMITASALPYPSNATQQGTAALSSAPVLAGVPVGQIAFYKWE
jgi:viroplasmin and RNaseH domain-containing protein